MSRRNLLITLFLTISLSLHSNTQAQNGFGFIPSTNGGFGGNGFGNGLSNSNLGNPALGNNSFGNSAVGNSAFGNGAFGNASSWVNGFSQALVQIPAFQQNSSTGPMLSPIRRTIQLGAYIQNTETGVLITDVAPNSLAQAAGLQPNDYVISVGGYQVGIVSNRTYDIAEEIQKRIDPLTGSTFLLVMSRGRLENIPFSANGSVGSMISGRVALVDGTPIPQGSILKVELIDTTKRYQQIAGGSHLGAINSLSPYPYEIHFDPQYIDPRDQYQLVATITSYSGQLLAQGSQAIQAPAQGQSMNYDIRMQGAISQASSSGYLPGQDAIYNVFRTYLNRAPDGNEVNGWMASLAKGGTIDNMRAEILASRQFYDMVGNNEDLFLARLVQLTQNRQPNNQEIAALKQRLAGYRYSRLLLVRDYLATGR